jgi:nucleoside 2-deoxyribosyltransferase
VIDNHKQRLYLAGPLFSAAEKSFNAVLASELGKYISVYLPQRDGGLVVDLVATGRSVVDANWEVFSRDIDEIERCDFLLVVLDGRAVDEGAAFELGVAFSKGKICIGLQTDPRRLLPQGNNPMLDGALTAVFSRVDELLTYFETRNTAARPVVTRDKTT